MFAAQPAGFGEFGGGAFSLASEGISGGEAAPNEWCGRHVAARFFEPDDRLVEMRLQQMHGPNQQVANADQRIAGAQADGFLRERDHILYRSAIELAPGEAT